MVDTAPASPRIPRTETFIPIPKFSSDHKDGLEEDPRHKRLADHVRRLVQMSENQMSGRWGQWQETDRRHRMFVNPDEIDRFTGRLRRPHDVKLILPMSYAIHMNLLTFYFMMFAAKETLVPLEGRKVESVRSAKIMEELLDYDMVRAQARLMLYGWINDALKYGMGVEQDEWNEDWTRKTVRSREQISFFGTDLGSRVSTKRDWVRTYNGNRSYNVDPYTYRPDPRVPVGRVQDGDFAGYEWFRSITALIAGEQSGRYQNTDDLSPMDRAKVGSWSDQSKRWETMGLPAMYDTTGTSDETDRGYAFGNSMWLKIIPSDFDLGSDEPQIWSIALANYDTILRCEEWDYDHGELPFGVLEAHYDGYSPMNQGATEVVQPMTDIMDWLISSHIDNVKKALNNMLVLDPSRVNLDDLSRPGPAKWIRLRETAWGTDVRSAIHQFEIQDVTRQHVADVMQFMEWVVRATGALDPMMLGLQPRSKQQATVFTGQAHLAQARHKAIGLVMAEQGILPWVRRLVMNIQQRQDEDVMVKITGGRAKALGVEPNTVLNVSPDDVQGEFDYSPHIGDIPPDPMRAFEVWKETLFGVSKIPLLAQQFDVVEIFRQMVYTVGIKNIDAFRIRANVMPDDQVQKMMEQGKLAAAGEVMGNGQGRGRQGEGSVAGSGSAPRGALGPGAAPGLGALLAGAGGPT
jgi:hypothetical protein